MIDNIRTGRLIAELRLSRGLTQQQLASMLGVSHQAVSKWESGQALPDIATMLELTRFFGIAIEQLITEQIEAPEEEKEIKESPLAAKEVRDMNLQQLVQMAPFMSKEAVEEIVMGMQERLSAGQLVKIAPFVRPECLEALLEKHAPELDWDALRKLAPFMSRDAVDALARRIASGETTVKTPEDAFNKTMNDIGKAFDDFGRGVERTFGDIGKGMEKTFDDIGKGVDKAFRKAVKIGECVVNEVSKAFSAEDDTPTAVSRSERVKGIRRKAFDRALADEKWDWIGLHIGEVREDTEMMAKIAEAARELGKHDFIRAHMSEYANMETIDQAIAGQDWEWLGENVWQYDGDVQEKIAMAAAAKKNWDWLLDYSEPMELVDCGYDIARAAMAEGENKLLGRFADRHLIESQCDALAAEAYAGENFGALDALLDKCSPAFREHVLAELAQKGAWEKVCGYVKRGDGEIVEKLMELAVEQGNFEAIDLLDALL
ncbi:MAG: helix-turn-helix transcriptional regulator [Clostridia bacterium]|nr:helix-turn-helix transcriptional regulator [Clostridia bacterium]